jgi:hypothetical protein
MKMSHEETKKALDELAPSFIRNFGLNLGVQRGRTPAQWEEIWDRHNLHPVDFDRTEEEIAREHNDRIMEELRIHSPAFDVIDPNYIIPNPDEAPNPFGRRLEDFHIRHRET